MLHKFKAFHKLSFREKLLEHLYSKDSKDFDFQAGLNKLKIFMLDNYSAHLGTEISETLYYYKERYIF